jgi:tetratricopeptide (TPR) repeat protein
VDNATKRELKQHDQFVSMTESGIQWANQNRRSAITAAASILALILLIVGATVVYTHRTEQASNALGTAMQAYQAPVADSGQPIPPGTKSYPTAKDRAAASNTLFVDVADHYSLTKPGKVARYFAGLTYMEEGQNAQAEESLKKAASAGDENLSALAKLALAQLDRETGRDAQAIDEYQELAKGHATTVPPGMAQIKLAELYAAQGKTDESRKLYAKVKDSDKDNKGKPGPLATLAEQKLNPKSAAAEE